MRERWQTLPEWVEVRVPSKDGKGRQISKQRRVRWLRVWERFLLSPTSMSGTGYEVLIKQGKWRRGTKGSFDPKTGDFRVIDERVEGITMYCTRKRLRSFEPKMRRLLIEMGRDLSQDVVAYSTKKGLHTKPLNPHYGSNSGREGSENLPRADRIGTSLASSRGYPNRPAPDFTGAYEKRKEAHTGATDHWKIEENPPGLRHQESNPDVGRKIHI